MKAFRFDSKQKIGFSQMASGLITEQLKFQSKLTPELMGNDIHVDNDVGSAYGYYLATATMAVRSMFNHIHVVGATSYAWFVDTDVTLNSQFDDVIATTSTVNGTLHEANSRADGDMSLSDELYTDTIKEYTAVAGVTIDGVLLKDGDVGATGTKITKGWFTDLEITNAPSVNGTALSSDHLSDVASIAASGANTDITSLTGCSDILDNIFIGVGVAGSLDGGSQNIGIGKDALNAVTEGNNLIAIGYGALDAVTTADQSVAIGNFALHLNTSGYNNTALGFNTLGANTEGYNNTGIGMDALYSNTTGDNNTALGYYAGYYHADGATPLIPNNSV